MGCIRKVHSQVSHLLSAGADGPWAPGRGASRPQGVRASEDRRTWLTRISTFSSILFHTWHLIVLLCPWTQVRTSLCSISPTLNLETQARVHSLSQRPWIPSPVKGSALTPRGGLSLLRHSRRAKPCVRIHCAPSQERMPPRLWAPAGHRAGTLASVSNTGPDADPTSAVPFVQLSQTNI